VQRSRINESVGFLMAGLIPAIQVVQFKKIGRFSKTICSQIVAMAGTNRAMTGMELIFLRFSLARQT